MLAADRMRNKADTDRRKGKLEASTSDSNISGPSLSHPQVNELAQVMNFLKEEVERLKVERRQMYKGPQNTENRGGFRRSNNIARQTMHRERGRDG
jgi:uncharacterized small protein (DUF1192 family)